MRRIPRAASFSNSGAATETGIRIELETQDDLGYYENGFVRERLFGEL